MTPTPDLTSDVARAIQLALAPVFLLTGIAGMLNVMAGRLARIIDRGRTLQRGQGGPLSPEQVDLEVSNLERRRYFASVAITACTIAALLVCMVIASLFVEVMLSVPLNWLIGTLFTGSTLALVVGLAYFLREVHWATQTIRLRAVEHERKAATPSL